MDSLLRASNVYQRPPQAEREEKSGWIWKNKVTGKYTFYPLFGIQGTPCQTNGPAPTNRVVGEDTLVAIYHSHPFYRGEDIRTVCGNQDLEPYDPDKYGGGSPEDWINANNWGLDFKGIDAIIVTPERVHLLKNRTRADLRESNPNGWSLTKDRCLKP
jgi:hypothetical protein